MESAQPGSDGKFVTALTWAIALASIGAIIIRPWRRPEWMWAVGGAAALVALNIVSASHAVAAIGRGTDVYFFLVGMLVLGELCRASGVFDWLAGIAVDLARGSAVRFYTLVFIVGVAVTAVLSNDATAVVLTPAVAAAARRAGAKPLPHLYTCAFVANAASFLLPVGNPANFVIFASKMPALGTWLALFCLPSFAGLVLTYVALRFVSRRDLRESIAPTVRATPLERSGRIALGGIALTAVALTIASSRALPLGIATAICAAIVYIAAVTSDRSLARVMAKIAWGVLPLVAGLFVIVAGIDSTGVLASVRAGVRALGHVPTWSAVFGAGFATALISNITNNLPTGLFAGLALGGVPHQPFLAAATTIGVDLGPNLSVTGSLATILWLMALRREEIEVGPIAFLRVGAVVMFPALIAALGALVFIASR